MARQAVTGVAARPRSDIVRALVVEIAILAAVLLAVARFVVPAVLLAAVVIALLVPVRGRTALGWLWGYLEYARRRPVVTVRPGLPADLVPLAQWVPHLDVSQTAYGRTSDLGVITDGQGWTAVLALEADDDLLADSGERIDLAALSGLTVQDDIVFAGVQVVTYTVPAPTTVLLGARSSAAEAYRQIAGTPPPAMRRTWLCLRLDPRLCLEAVARRGASDEGVRAALRFGLHRVQSVLKRQGIETVALSPLEIYQVLGLTSGAGPDPSEVRSDEEWTTWTCDGLVHTGLLVRGWGQNPSVGYQAVLDAVSDAPCLFSVTSYTLTPTRRAVGGVRVVGVDEAGAHAAMGHVTAAMDGVRLGRPGGRQASAVLATVPLGR